MCYCYAVFRIMNFVGHDWGKASVLFCLYITLYICMIGLTVVLVQTDTS